MVLSLYLQIGYEKHGNFRFRSKPVFYSLTAVDPKTPPKSRLELFITIPNTIVLAIAKRITSSINYCRKDLCRVSEPAFDYQKSLLALLTFWAHFRLLFQHTISILDQSKTCTSQTFVFIRKIRW